MNLLGAVGEYPSEVLIKLTRNFKNQHKDYDDFGKLECQNQRLGGGGPNFERSSEPRAGKALQPLALPGFCQ